MNQIDNYDLTEEDQDIMNASTARVRYWKLDNSNYDVWGVPLDGFVGYVTWVEEFNRRSEQA